MFDTITENQRRMEYKGVRAILNRIDPYGLWEVSLEKGTTPEALRGSFVSPKDGYYVITSYIDDKEKEQTKKDDRPTIKYKKVKDAT